MDERLKQYQHAMEIDSTTDKPMQKVAAQLTGSKVEEQKTEMDATSGSLTFAENIEYIGIYNRDATNDGVFNVNGINITVPAGEAVDFHIGGTPSTTVTVTGATTYILTRYV